MNHQLQPGNSYQILYSLNGDELLYGEYKTLEEAASKFAYLKENWVDIFPEGLTAIELADQYFDEVEQFNPWATRLLLMDFHADYRQFLIS